MRGAFFQNVPNLLLVLSEIVLTVFDVFLLKKKSVLEESSESRWLLTVMDSMLCLTFVTSEGLEITLFTWLMITLRPVVTN